MRRLWMFAIAAGTFALCADGVAQTRSAPNPRATAAADTALRIVVSLRARRLWAVTGEADTLLAAPVAVGSGKTLRGSGQTWVFDTPRGMHVVLSKEEDPVWVRPEWSYIEVAGKHHLRLAHIDAAKRISLDDRAGLEIRDGVVVLVGGDGAARALPTDEEVIFGGVLYVPPLETVNRRVPGQLGRYRLNLGNGIGVHGTPDSASVGRAVTHGCLRVHDDDLEWLHEHIPLGTRVYIF